MRRRHGDKEFGGRNSGSVYLIAARQRAAINLTDLSPLASVPCQCVPAVACSALRGRPGVRNFLAVFTHAFESGNGVSGGSGFADINFGWIRMNAAAFSSSGALTPVPRSLPRRYRWHWPSRLPRVGVSSAGADKRRSAKTLPVSIHRGCTAEPRRRAGRKIAQRFSQRIANSRSEKNPTVLKLPFATCVNRYESWSGV